MKLHHADDHTEFVDDAAMSFIAHGVVAQYFEADESVATIRTGSYDKEN